MAKLIMIMLTMVLVNNYVLRQFLGICSFIGVSKDLKNAVGMSLAVIVVMALATAVTYPIQKALLDPLDMGYLQTIVFILVIAALVQLVEFTLKKYSNALYRALGVYLPLITTNCAVLGVTILNIDSGYTFAESMVCAVGSGLGYFLAMVIFSGIRSRVEYSDPPESFKGLPITMISAAILSLAFFGFDGIVENLFGG